jgi:hypothetical protein
MPGPLWAGRMPEAHFGQAACLPHWTLGTELLCATVSAGRHLEVRPAGREGPDRVSLRVEIWRKGPRGWPARLGRAFCPVHPDLPGLPSCLASSEARRCKLESLRHMGGPGCQRVSPLTTGLDLLPRMDRTTRRAVPSPVLHAGSITVPTPLLRNRFQSLVRFPSRHAAVRSADEPVSPGFDPSCEG